MSVIKKLFSKGIYYNLLSLLNVFLGFVFIVLIGREFGASLQSDTYFLSIVVITYLGYFIQSVWEAFTPYFAEAKLKDFNIASKMFSVLLNYLIIVAIFMVFIYFFISSTFEIEFLNEELKSFLNVFIFYLIFQNILFLNKTILNLEGFYASFYFVDIFVHVVNILTILFLMHKDLIVIAYSSIIATILVNIWQFLLIFKKLKLRYYFSFYIDDTLAILKNSSKLKLSSIILGIKDLIVAWVFVGFGAGSYSLYSYANKFLGVIMQIANAPVVNIFAAKATHLIAQKRYSDSVKMLKDVYFKSISLYVLGVSVTYFLIPYIIRFLFSDKFNESDIVMIREIFFIMSFYYLCIVIASPTGRVLTILKEFNFYLLNATIYSTIIVISYFFDYESVYHFLYMLVFAATIYATNISFFYKKSIRGLNDG